LTFEKPPDNRGNSTNQLYLNEKVVFLMLGVTRNHKDYQAFVLAELQILAEARPDQIMEYQNAISKMLILNLDPLIGVISQLYPPSGRPAKNQTEIFRSFVLMRHCGIPLDNWVNKLTYNPVLRIIAGFGSASMPKTSSYYDFISRVVKMDERPAAKPFKPKPRKKLRQGEKLPPKHPGIVDKLVNRLIGSEEKFIRSLSRRPERFLQRIFARVAVDSSVQLGLVPPSADVSGDGTCIETGAAHYGKKVCECVKNGVYNCTCDRRFSDPNATWGWDSHNEHYFYGYSGYFISSYNRDLKLDLPLYIRLLEAGRHDSVSAVFALAEFRELNPGLRINTFISDSASDNYATYKLLDHWNVNAVIALNPKNEGNSKLPSASGTDINGTPVCPGGRKMIYNGFCKDRCRFKWRCPRVVKKLDTCVACASCSPSAYGRVIYTKPDWDLRLFPRIPRGSLAWKRKMSERTAAERINDRILIDYGVEDSLARGKKRISFITVLAAINIHLDAQLKVLIQRKMFDFAALLHLDMPA
jgi:hypothetical protein